MSLCVLHQGLCLCLDFQFDTVVRDRPVILSKLLLLHSLRQEIPALSWEFFVNRFETLSLEAQLHLDCNKEFPFPTSECASVNCSRIQSECRVFLQVLIPHPQTKALKTSQFGAESLK